MLCLTYTDISLNFNMFHLQEIKKEFSVSNEKMMLQAKDQGKGIQNPKFAPQLDGLHCFETFVMD